MFEGFSLDQFGLQLPTFLGGFIGGVCSLRFITNLTWKEALVAVIGGAFCAGYVTPLITDMFALSSQLESAVSFLVGVFGMSLLGLTFKLITAFRDDPKDTFSGAANALKTFVNARKGN